MKKSDAYELTNWNMKSFNAKASLNAVCCVLRRSHQIRTNGQEMQPRTNLAQGIVACSVGLSARADLVSLAQKEGRCVRSYRSMQLPLCQGHRNFFVHNVQDGNCDTVGNANHNI